MNKMMLLIGASGIAVGTILGASLKDHLSASAFFRTSDQSTIEPIKALPATATADSAPNSTSPFAVAKTVETDTGTREKDPTEIQTLANLHHLSNYKQLLSALQYVDNADTAALAELVGQPNKLMLHQPASTVFIQAIFQRWADVDVTAVVDWINAQVQPESAMTRQYHTIDHNFLMEAVSGLVQASPDRADEWLNSITDEPLRQMFNYRVMNEIGRLDPAAALAKLGNDDNDMGNRYSIINDWAFSDPQAALAWIQANSSMEDRAEFENVVFSAWLERDPEAAMAEIERLPDSPEKVFLRGRYAGMLASTDPAAAFESAVDAAQGDLQSMHSSLNEIVWQWAESDLAGLRQRIEGESDPTLHAIFLDIAGPQIASYMANQDPVAAMNWIETLPASQQSVNKPQVFQQWISMDADAAVAWLQQQAPGDAQLNAAAIWHLPESHLDLALSLFPSLETHIQSGITHQLVYQLHSQQPHMLESWVAGINDPQVKQLAVSAKDSLDAMDNVDERLAELDYLEGEEKVDQMFELFQSLSMIEPERIEQWMQDNPLTITEQRLLEQRAMEQDISGVSMEGCAPPYLPGMYGASRSIRY